MDRKALNLNVKSEIYYQLSDRASQTNTSKTRIVEAALKQYFEYPIGDSEADVSKASEDDGDAVKKTNQGEDSILSYLREYLNGVACPFFYEDVGVAEDVEDVDDVDYGDDDEPEARVEKLERKQSENYEAIVRLQDTYLPFVHQTKQLKEDVREIKHQLQSLKISSASMNDVRQIKEQLEKIEASSDALASVENVGIGKGDASKGSEDVGEDVEDVEDVGEDVGKGDASKGSEDVDVGENGDSEDVGKADASKGSEDVDVGEDGDSEDGDSEDVGKADANKPLESTSSTDAKASVDGKDEADKPSSEEPLEGVYEHSSDEHSTEPSDSTSTDNDDSKPSSEKPLEPVYEASSNELSKGLNQKQLADRLKVTPGNVTHHKKKGNIHFKEWSKEKDPDNIAWYFESKKFYPVSDN